MFRVIAAIWLVILTFVPPLFVITIPVGTIWAIHIHERRAKFRRAFDVDPPTKRTYELARQKALKSW